MWNSTSSAQHLRSQSRHSEDAPASRRRSRRNWRLAWRDFGTFAYQRLMSILRLPGEHSAVEHRHVPGLVHGPVRDGVEVRVLERRIDPGVQTALAADVPADEFQKDVVLLPRS